VPQKKFMLLLFALLFYSADIACAPSWHSGENTQGDALIILEGQKLAPIHPILTSSTLSANLIDIIYDGLIQLDDGFEPKPHLAESWERSADGLTWTFHLRKGVRFHDGSKLTAEDAAYTFQKLRDLPVGSFLNSIFKEVESIKVIGSHALQIVLKRPIASFLPMLTVGIMPKHESVKSFPVGTGPYKINSWSEMGVLLVANEDYFLGRPNIDQIRVVVDPNPKTVWARLAGGEADLYFDPLSAHDEILRFVPGFETRSIENPYYYMVTFNLNDTLFRDPRVRQALNYAVNKEEIIDQVLKGQGQAVAGTIHPSSWAYNPKIRPYPYDSHKALTLLQKAGWEDRDGDHLLDKEGKPFEFTVYLNIGDDLKQKALLLIQKYLSDIGIKMRANYVDAANIDFLFNKQFQAVFVETLAAGDPDFSYSFWHSSQIEKGFNVSSYRNEQVDRFLEEGRTEFDREKRKTNYFKYQEEIYKDPPGIFLFWTNYLVEINRRFKGVKISSAGGPFANIREWYVPKPEQRYTKYGDLRNAEKNE
jgi:peptide/nickel transport system substrate-binding protein